MRRAWPQKSRTNTARRPWTAGKRSVSCSRTNRPDDYRPNSAFNARSSLPYLKAASCQLAVGNGLLLDDGLLLVLRAFPHEAYDRLVVIVLMQAGGDHRVLLEQALLALGARSIELL